MRHFVNWLLLLCFTTLVVSGLLRFFQPFALGTTRVHIVFGFGVLTLVALHLAARTDYFIRILKRPAAAGSARAPRRWLLLGGVAGVWALLLAAALWDLPPATQLIRQSYESKNRAAIFRPEKTAAARELDNGFQMRRMTPGEAMVMVELIWGPAFGRRGRLARPFDAAEPQIAIWAESETGAMIETFFVSEQCAFAEQVKWAGHALRRVDILPLWRHSYTLINRIDPNGAFDGFSGATPKHSFSIRDYLQVHARPFNLNVEVNLANDTNAFYHPNQPRDSAGYVRPGLGQPSVLYSARIDPGETKKYYLLDLVAHSGSSSEMDGKLFYNTEHLTTAKDLIERVLVKVVMERAGDPALPRK